MKIQLNPAKGKELGHLLSITPDQWITYVFGSTKLKVQNKGKISDSTLSGIGLGFYTRDQIFEAAQYLVPNKG